MKYIQFVIGLMLIITVVKCANEKIDCGYNGMTIDVIHDQDALVKQIGSQFFLRFDIGLLIDSPNLLDTIYILLPCNLPGEFKVNEKSVIVSGQIKDNPGFSSHNNYTDFFITKIK